MEKLSPSTTPANAPSSTQITGTPSGTAMTPEYVATITRFAYVWGWPLENNLNRAFFAKDVPAPGRLGRWVKPSRPKATLNDIMKEQLMKLLVTPDNFPRAETDFYMNAVATQRGGFGKFTHDRTPTPLDRQTVIRMNRDTLYSAAVFDLDAGPVTVTLPDTGNRFMSMQVINEDEFTPMVAYGKGSYALTKDKIETRYVLVALRTLVNPDDPRDVEDVHKLQDAVNVSQKSPGTWEMHEWDKASQDKVRAALITLASTLPDMKNAFGPKGEVDPVRYLIASAAAWGGNPNKDAIYLNVTPQQNDGKIIYKLHIDKNVPVDSFWSISLYNAQGYFEQNSSNSYTLNNITAKKEADGSVNVQFGGCDGKTPNCLPIMPGWNYMVRLYRPRPDVLSGAWKFPEAQPAT